MGFFGGVKDIYKKTEAARVLQNLLEHQARIGLLTGNPAQVANDLVELIWQERFSVLSGEFGQRPHKISVAAVALAYFIRILKEGNSDRDGFIISLGNLLSELNTNGRLYPLNSLDETLIEEAVLTFVNATKARPSVKPSIGGSMNSGYSSFEKWYAEFKAAAGAVNPQLRNSNSKSLIDFMDHEPLRCAFREGVEPRELGQEFAESFDLNSFLSVTMGEQRRWTTS